MTLLSQIDSATTSGWKPNSHTHIYFLEDGFVYAASSANPVESCRQPGVILISLDDKPITVVASQQSLSGEIVIIAPQVKRRIFVNNTRFLAVHIEPAHPRFSLFFKHKQISPLSCVKPGNLAWCMDQLVACHEGSLSKDEAQLLFDVISESIFTSSSEAFNRDERIEWLLENVNAKPVKDYSFNQLLEQLDISRSRLSHLFKDEVGLSLRSYVKWRKIRESLMIIGKKDSLTSVAYQCGFSDSAHFSRSFKSILGVNASALLNSTIVKFIR